MARLSTLRPLVGKLPPRIGSRQQKETIRLKERESNVDWRKWYHSERWKRLRQQVLVRDGYVCQQTGVLLTGKHPAPNSPTVHHRKPHRGDAELFWAIDNLESVAKSWHDSIAQALENAEKTAAFHPKWLKPSLIPLTIVCGPPASGKSTYVRDHAGRKDLVIDLDVIAAEISGEPLHSWDRRWLNAALYRRNNMLGDLGRPSAYPAAWFIVSEPKAKHRQFWQDTLRPQAIIVLETDERQCLANARNDPDRNINRTESSVTTWWSYYTRRVGETRIQMEKTI